ncbi:MAG: zinc ribbon domain-containing protein [Butyrivibrio sp.]|nr:zinc ribbon domain-containing protein [Butyrivibrio sp.]
MKYCGKCGKQMNDGDNFCPSCGAPWTGAAPQPAREYSEALAAPSYTYGPSDGAGSMYTYDTSDGARPMYIYDTAAAETQIRNISEQKSSEKGEAKARLKRRISKRALIPILGAAAALLVLLLVFFFRCVAGSGSLTQNGAVKAYYDALGSRNGEKLLDATVSDSLLKAIEEESGFNKSHIIRLMRASLTASGDNVSYRHVKITDAEEYDKSEINDFVQSLERKLGTTVKISAMCAAKVSYEIWNSYYEEWQEYTGKLVLYKSGGSWYVMPDNLDY